MVISGATFETTVTDAGPGLLGTLSVRVEDGQGNVVVAETTDGIVASGVGIYTATIVAVDHAGDPLPAGQYVVVWNDGAGNEAASTFEVIALGDETFASVDDVRRRLGGAPLSPAREDQALLLLQLATGLIAEAAEEDDAWAAALSPVPKIFRLVCLEVVVRVMTNPEGVRSTQEQLGAHQHSRSFADSTIGFALTEREIRLVRDAMGIPTSGSARVASMASDPLPLGSYGSVAVSVASFEGLQTA